jgi:hypothetical protein
MADLVEPDRIVVLCCQVPGCGHKQIGAPGYSWAACPTHRTPLLPTWYERMRAPVSSSAQPAGAIANV